MPETNVSSSGLSLKDIVATCAIPKYKQCLRTEFYHDKQINLRKIYASNNCPMNTSSVTKTKKGRIIPAAENRE